MKMADEIRDKRKTKRKRIVRSNGTHHEGVNKEIVVLEGIKSRGSVNAISAGFAELQDSHHSGESPKNEKVEELHCRSTGGERTEKRKLRSEERGKACCS